jgi:hypothetical protein
MLKKRKQNVKKYAKHVEQTLLLLCDEKAVVHVQPDEVCRLLPSTVFVNSSNMANINFKRLPGHNIALTSHIVSTITLMPTVISNIIVMFLSNDKLRIDPTKCEECMFPLHKSLKGLSINCKSHLKCIACSSSLISTSAISQVKCNICNGFIAHEGCIDRVRGNMCEKCVPLENRLQCICCHNIAFEQDVYSTCTTCYGYLCRSCKKKKKCMGCFQNICEDCQENCMECNDRFCNTCWNAEAFDCRFCSNFSLCRKCSTSNASCDVCQLSTDVCVLCSTFDTCALCNQRTCEDCTCRCDSNDCDDYMSDDYDDE